MKLQIRIEGEDFVLSRGGVKLGVVPVLFGYSFACDVFEWLMLERFRAASSTP